MEGLTRMTMYGTIARMRFATRSCQRVAKRIRAIVPYMVMRVSPSMPPPCYRPGRHHLKLPRQVGGERGEPGGHAMLTDFSGAERLPRGDTRGTDRYGYRGDLRQGAIVADAVANDLVKAAQQDVHEVLIATDGVIEWRAARADHGGADEAERTIWTNSEAPDRPAAGVRGVCEVVGRGQPARSCLPRRHRVAVRRQRAVAGNVVRRGATCQRTVDRYRHGGEQNFPTPIDVEAEWPAGVGWRGMRSTGDTALVDNKSVDGARATLVDNEHAAGPVELDLRRDAGAST